MATALSRFKETCHGNTPASIVAGDFDSNGHIDLAVANSGSATASVLLGNGDFTFQAQKTSPTGTSPISITSGDFNGDGNTDVAVANNNSNNVSILLNQLTDTATASFTGIDVPGSGSNHNVEATYPGDGNFNPSTSTTVALGSTKISTSTLLSASTTTPAFGQQVVLTATLVPSLVGALTPTGTVTFKNGGATLGTATVSGGLATLNVTSLTAGIHSLTAIYAGDTNFVTSTSPALGVTVSKATPVITWPTPSPITYGTLLSSLQQNASTTAAGTFAYNPAPFTLLSVRHLYPEYYLHSNRFDGLYDCDCQCNPRRQSCNTTDLLAHTGTDLVRYTIEWNPTQCDRVRLQHRSPFSLLQRHRNLYRRFNIRCSPRRI